MLFIIFKKCADFLFSFSLCFPQVLNLSILAWRQIGNPKSLLPCKWCNCFPETMLSDITLERIPKIPPLHPKTTSLFYRTESHILGWLSGIFNFLTFTHFPPNIRRAITWRALAFRLDRYWIYSYSILQNKDVNRNMIGGFFSLRFISWSSWRCFAAEQYITENWLFDEISACPCQRLSLSNTQHRDSH